MQYTHLAFGPLSVCSAFSGNLWSVLVENTTLSDMAAVGISPTQRLATELTGNCSLLLFFFSLFSNLCLLMFCILSVLCLTSVSTSSSMILYLITGNSTVLSHQATDGSHYPGITSVQPLQRWKLCVSIAVYFCNKHRNTYVVVTLSFTSFCDLSFGVKFTFVFAMKSCTYATTFKKGRHTEKLLSVCVCYYVSIRMSKNPPDIYNSKVFQVEL